MAEVFAKKKRICGGHRASATRMLQQVSEMVAASEADPAALDIKRLLQLKLSLEEKLSTLKQLDGEILDLIDNEDGVTDEIEQADEFKERMQRLTSTSVLEEAHHPQMVGNQEPEILSGWHPAHTVLRWSYQS